MPEREAALARGFVLGQDQDIPASTVRDFRDSGLAHLLAVSGQNVVLLGLLAIPFLALAGLRSRARLLALAAIILVYIPVAGGGPSIQRAGVMGLAVLAAAAVDRPVMRTWSLCLAAAVTLILNPLSTADPGWQLSFAAVVGIALLARPIARRLGPVRGSGPGSPMRAIADGFGVTVAASLATLPLIALHFDRIPVATVTANLLAMPAVAPSMWLGMAAGAIGQLSPALAVPLNLVNSVLLGFIAQIAEWFGGQSWSALEIGVDSPARLAGAYLILGLICGFGLAISRPSSDASGVRGAGSSRVVAVAIASFLLLVAPVLATQMEPGRRTLAAPPPGGARIEFLDVGQGDAILIRPHGVDPVLVDFGPPGAGILEALRSASVRRLSAAVLTHMDLDHAGGIYEVLDSVPVGTLIHDDLDRRATLAARRAGTDLLRVEAGDGFRLGPVELEVLWPPPGTERTEPRDSERNARSVVLLVSWRDRRILLTGDAEAEEVSLVPGRLDVLKLAHHGSDDAGLPTLLATARPELGIISAGAGNRHGHPTDAVLAALDEAGVGILRTDRQGTLSVVFGGSKLGVETGR
jgi:competence protein ComEC